MIERRFSGLLSNSAPVRHEPTPHAESLTQQVLDSRWPAIELTGWIILILVVLGAAFTYGSLLGYHGVGDLLLSSRSHSGGGIAPLLAGVEFAAIPLTAIAAAWLRLGTDRIQTVRATWVGPFLPLLMAASIVGLLAYFTWSNQHLQYEHGPDGFAFTRWVGTALAAAFAVIWLPPFPRITSILAGMIAGIAIFALIGYLFFESSLSHGDECALGPFLYSVLAILIGFSFLSGLGWLKLAPLCVTPALIAASSDVTAIQAVVALFIAISAWLAVLSLFLRPVTARPLTCALVSGSLAIGLAVLGGDFGYSCGAP